MVTQMKCLRNVMLPVAAFLLYASPAAAFISAEGLVGMKNSVWKANGESTTISGTTVKVGAHLDPIPLVPVSFGLSLDYDQFGKGKDVGIESGTTLSVTPEVMAWLPLGDIKPYGRLGYTLVSFYKAEAKEQLTNTKYDVAYRGAGVQMGAGVRYSILPLIALLGEVNYSQQKLEVTEAKLVGVDIKNQLPDPTVTSTAFLIGVEVGL